MPPRIALLAEETLRLQALGALVKDAHSRAERDVHIDTVLLVVHQHRDAGITWAVLARALGISSSTLRDWRRRDRPTKPTLPERVPAMVIQPVQRPREEPSRLLTRSTDAATSLSVTQVQHASQTASSSAVSVARSSNLATPAGVPPRRMVLVLTGDPRPGGNLFDPEVARIRDRLHGMSVRHRHVAMIGLGEIAGVVDQERPAVLHLCAHRGPGGLALSLDERPHFVTPDDVAAALERARHAPRCAILSFCSSIEIAARLARRIPAVITWPGQVEDEQATCYVGQLYRHVVAGVRLPDAVTEAGRVVATCWPELAPPALRGRWGDPVM